MPNDEQFARLREVLCRELRVPPEAVTVSSSMDNLEGWDSLRFLFVVSAVEKEFGVKFKRQQLPSLRSVKGLVDALDSLR
jgi:acyl carrier protein